MVALADAAQVAAELGEPTRRPRLAGRHYALLPVVAPGAFHAKIGLFLGPRSARVFVGSHNLTMSGFGLNREVTNVIEIEGREDREGAAAVQEVLSFSRAWAAKLAPSLMKSLEDLAAFAQPYQGPISTTRSVTVVGSRPEGVSLWERVLPLLPDSAERVTIVGPFFDDKLSFLNRVRADLQPGEFVVGVDPSTVCFPAKATLMSDSRLVDASCLCPKEAAEGYLHAKAILIESGSERTLITGSANPTFAAWLAWPAARNAEVVVVRKLGIEDDDLGLGQLVAATTVPPGAIGVPNSRQEPLSSSDKPIRLLVGAASGDSVVVENPPVDILQVEVSSAEGRALSASFEMVPNRLVIHLPQLDDAALFRLVTACAVYHGWVHHVQALHQMALPSSQRRIRDALGGLGGDPSRLEQLLKMVEKVIFQGSALEAGRPGTKSKRGEEKEPESDSKVVFVPTLQGEAAEGRRRLSSGDLGLLLDALMRQLWRSLTHEQSASARSESELVGSEDEDRVEELPTDPRVAELWRKKTATLLRRLTRRVKEGDDKAQVIIECAGVLGVLEAVRRVEDHDRWKRIKARFLDRDLAARFLIEAAPQLLLLGGGVLDSASEEAGGAFEEQEALLRWLIWLAWIAKFGPSELLRRLRESEDPLTTVVGLASMGMLAGRIGDLIDGDERSLELLQSAPRPGIRPDEWLAELRTLGRVVNDPASVPRARRAPMTGDLVAVSLEGKKPMFVLCVGLNKVELIDFAKPDLRLVMLTNRVEVLEPAWADQAGYSKRAI